MSAIGAGLVGLGSVLFGKKGRQRRKRRRQRRREKRRERRGLRHDRQMDEGEGFGELQRQGAEQAAEARGLQRAAYDQYAAMARGEGPSLAQQQVAAQGQQNVVNQMGMAAAGRGGNLASQARQASAAGAAGAMGTQQQLGQLRAQEQQLAMQGQAAMAGQMGAQAQQLQLGGAGMGLQHGLGQRGLDLQQLQGSREFGLGIAQTAGQVASSVGGAVASDERVKSNVRGGGLAASKAIGEIEPKSFEYKPGFGSPGERVGILAQDLEKTPEGASIVREMPYGKAVDIGGLSSLAAAGAAENMQQTEKLDERMRRLEQSLGLAQAKGRK